MPAKLRAGMRGHAAADSDREMIAARERPDVAFKLRQEFDGDGVGVLRHEVALRHFQLVALERAAARDKLEMTQGYFVPQNADSIDRKSTRLTPVTDVS